MGFTPGVKIVKSGDRLTVLVRQKYRARGWKIAHRWVLANIYSLKELERIERESYK